MTTLLLWLPMVCVPCIPSEFPCVFVDRVCNVYRRCPVPLVCPVQPDALCIGMEGNGCPAAAYLTYTYMFLKCSFEKRAFSVFFKKKLAGNSSRKIRGERAHSEKRPLLEPVASPWCTPSQCLGHPTRRTIKLGLHGEPSSLGSDLEVLLVSGFWQE
jgi:hypothetical protein